MKKIKCVEIMTTEDDFPDISWMGHYSDKAETEFAIYRTHAGPRQFRYFNGPVENYKGETKENIRKYIQQDYKRMEELNEGSWCFIGMRVRAEILTSEDGKVWLANHVTSSGLWGIESDSDKEYLKEVADEQLDELKSVLLELGFNKKEIESSCVLPE